MFVSWLNKFERTKKVIKVGEINGIDDKLTVEEKRSDLIEKRQRLDFK